MKNKQEYPRGTVWHHLLFTRKTWESQEPTRRIRNNPWLIAPLNSDWHIHNEIKTVPLLDHHTAKTVERYYVPIQDDYIGSVFSLMRCIDKAIRTPLTGQVERSLGELTMHALELQVPFLKDELITLN